jgi:DNA-binding response OmpR family regulator
MKDNHVTNHKPVALVVEDDTSITYLIDYLLSKEGYAVESKDDGEKGCRYIETMPAPDIVVLDIGLPRLDGVSLLHKMRAMPGWQDVPIIMLSAKNDERTLSRAIALGATDYVSKPFSPTELVERVRRHQRPLVASASKI